jgi:precorrin-2 dehydrogenase / sirohydrochlorin ferrochelatase
MGRLIKIRVRTSPVTDPAFSAPYAAVLDLTDRPVLIVGGGSIAAHKALGLVAAGARVTVVAPEAVSDLRENPHIDWHERSYQRGEVASYRLAITATDDAATNAQVAKDGDAANVFVNSADDAANCTFILPAVARRGDLQLMVSTNGRSPALARWFRGRLEAELTDIHLDLLDLMSEVRQETKARGDAPGSGIWDQAVDDRLLQLLGQGHHEQARDHLRAALGLAPQ